MTNTVILSFQLLTNHIVLSWPTNAEPQMVLQSKADFNRTNWINHDDDTTVVGTNFVAALSANKPERYFRLCNVESAAFSAENQEEIVTKAQQFSSLRMTNVISTKQRVLPFPPAGYR